MILKYAGLKPIISEHGISFKDGKEDKFIYLSYAIDILIALNHEYKKETRYSHQLDNKRLNSQEILAVLLKFHPKLEMTMNQEVNSYLKHLDKEEKEVFGKTNLKEIEKNVFINNLKLMKAYKIQRAKNKIFYFHCMETIVEIIIKHKIKEIDTPFNERFWHILQTLEGELSHNKISSKLEMIEDEDVLKAILNVNIY